MGRGFSRRLCSPRSRGRWPSSSASPASTASSFRWRPSRSASLPEAPRSASREDSGTPSDARCSGTPGAASSASWASEPRSSPQNRRRSASPPGSPRAPWPLSSSSSATSRQRDGSRPALARPRNLSFRSCAHTRRRRSSPRRRSGSNVVVLGALAPPVVVGLYGIARGLTRVLDLVRQASSHGYLPSASAAVARGEGDHIASLHVSTRRFAFALVWPILAVCLLAPAPLLGLLFGPAYEAAAPVLRLLALASFLSSFFDYLDLVLIAERRPGDVLRAGVASIAALVALLAALVPTYGGKGAALALLGSSLLRGLLLHRFVFRSRSFRPFLPAVAGPALLAAASLGVGATALRVLRPSPLAALLLAATTGGAAAAIALLAFFRKRAGGAEALPGTGADMGSSPP